MNRCAIGWMVAALLLVGPAGCDMPGPVPPDDDRSSVTLYVTNDHGRDVAVYAWISGVRRRMGSVATGSSRVFGLPVDWIGRGDLSLEVAADGSAERYRSDPIAVLGRVDIDLVVGGRLPQSHLIVDYRQPDDSQSRRWRIS